MGRHVSEQLNYFSSLALPPLQFGHVFPHDKCPFCSVQSYSFPYFYTRSAEGQFDITQPPHSRSSFFTLSSWFACLYLPYCPLIISSYNMPKPLRSKYFNLLKPTGHVMHQQFNIQQFYVLPTLYLCVLYLSENKQRLVPLTA